MQIRYNTPMKVLNKRVGSSQYILFLDLEGTQYTHEVISIGAILTKVGPNGTVTATKKGFHEYVIAQEKVSKFITELTGITQENISKSGLTFAEALRRLKVYVGVPFSKIKVCTFGIGDILMLQSSEKHQPSEEVITETVKLIKNLHIDFQALLNEYVKDDNGQGLSLANGLVKFNLRFEGAQHNALSDAINLMELYNAFQSSYEIVLYEYKKILERNKKLPRPVAKVLRYLNEGKEVTSQMYSKFIEDEVRDK